MEIMPALDRCELVVDAEEDFGGRRSESGDYGVKRFGLGDVI